MNSVFAKKVLPESIIALYVVVCLQAFTRSGHGLNARNKNELPQLFSWEGEVHMELVQPLTEHIRTWQDGVLIVQSPVKGGFFRA